MCFVFPKRLVFMWRRSKERTKKEEEEDENEMFVESLIASDGNGDK